MSTSHQAALELKHASLDRQITTESGRPSPDAQLLAGLKRQKLKLKEELAGI